MLVRNLALAVCLVSVVVTSADAAVKGWEYVGPDANGDYIWRATVNNACIRVHTVENGKVVTAINVSGQKKGNTVALKSNQNVGDC